MTPTVVTQFATKCRLASAGALLAALLAGCGFVGDRAAPALVEPGKYDYYDCAHLAQVDGALRKREQELVELLDRAGQDAVGQFVGTLSYRGELVQTRGQIKMIGQKSAEKNCAAQSPWQSDRALW